MQQVAEYRQANQALVLLAQRDLADFWASLNISRDPFLVRDELLLFLPDLVQTYGDTAAVLAADWYDSLRDAPVSASSFAAVLASPPRAGQVVGSAKWAVGPLFQDDPDAALRLLSGATQRLVLKSGRDSFDVSARRDPLRTSWARIPSGATTCRWCVMLASRGAVYANAAKAGEMNEFHDNCDCVQVPIRSDSDWPDGHDLSYFERLYVEQSGIGRDVPVF